MWIHTNCGLFDCRFIEEVHIFRTIQLLKHVICIFRTNAILYIFVLQFQLQIKLDDGQHIYGFNFEKYKWFDNFRPIIKTKDMQIRTKVRKYEKNNSFAMGCCHTFHHNLCFIARAPTIKDTIKQYAVGVIQVNSLFHLTMSQKRGSKLRKAGQNSIHYGYN